MFIKAKVCQDKNMEIRSEAQKEVKDFTSLPVLPADFEVGLKQMFF